MHRRRDGRMNAEARRPAAEGHGPGDHPDEARPRADHDDDRLRRHLRAAPRRGRRRHAPGRRLARHGRAGRGQHAPGRRSTRWCTTCALVARARPRRWSSATCRSGRTRSSPSRRVASAIRLMKAGRARREARGRRRDGRDDRAHRARRHPGDRPRRADAAVVHRIGGHQVQGRRTAARPAGASG